MPNSLVMRWALLLGMGSALLALPLTNGCALGNPREGAVVPGAPPPVGSCEGQVVGIYDKQKGTYHWQLDCPNCSCEGGGYCERVGETCQCRKYWAIPNSMKTDRVEDREPKACHAYMTGKAYGKGAFHDDYNCRGECAGGRRCKKAEPRQSDDDPTVWFGGCSCE